MGDPQAAPGRQVDLPAHWAVRRGVHGGVIAAVLLRAAGTTVPAHRPVSLSVHYLRPATPGRAHVAPEVLRAGRSTSVRVRLEQDGLLAEALAELSTTSPDPAHAAHTDLRAPAPDALPRLVTGLSGPAEERMELRVRSTWGADGARTESWARMVHPDDAETWGAAGSALVLADSLAPALLAGSGGEYVASTVGLTAHLLPMHDHDPAGWWHLAHRTVWASPELCLEDTAVRTPAGHLGLVVRQTRRLLGDHGLR